MQKELNLHYAGVHGTYWMYFGVLYSFSSVFLLGRGYSNANIGIILAIGNLIAVTVQPFLAHAADSGSKIAVFNIMKTMAILSAGLLVAMLFIRGGVGLELVYIGAIALLMMQQPFSNAVNRRLEETGAKIAYGSCRSVGSFTFAVICYLIGKVADAKGVDSIPVFGLCALMLFIIILGLTRKSYLKSMGAANSDNSKESRDTAARSDSPEVISLSDFIKTHRMFLILCLGILGLWFANSIPNSYMAQMVTYVGGESSDTGKIFALLALTEIPTMLIFDRLYRRFRTETMLKFAAVFFILWTAALGLAVSVKGLLLAQLIHFFCFPLFLPAIVRFIDDNMREGEAVKGQTMFTMVGTTSGILASIIGGVLLDKSTPKIMMLVAVISAAIGTAILFASIGKIKKLR